jgi:hypothetical protein
MIARPPLQNNSQGQRTKENQAKKHQYEIQIQRRINLAYVWKCERAQQENSGLPHEPAAKHQLGGGRSQAARRALVRGAL